MSIQTPTTTDSFFSIQDQRCFHALCWVLANMKTFTLMTKTFIANSPNTFISKEFAESSLSFWLRLALPSIPFVFFLLLSWVKLLTASILALVDLSNNFWRLGNFFLYHYILKLGKFFNEDFFQLAPGSFTAFIPNILLAHNILTATNSFTFQTKVSTSAYPKHYLTLQRLRRSFPYKSLRLATCLYSIKYSSFHIVIPFREIV